MKNKTKRSKTKQTEKKSKIKDNKTKTKQKKRVESIEKMHYNRNREFKIERRSDTKRDHRSGIQRVEQIS